MKKLFSPLLLVLICIFIAHTCKGACLNDYDCGFCQTCAAGLCVFQADSQDIKEECPASDCYTGLCSGSGGCGFSAAGTACAADGYSYTDDICDGAGICVHPVYQWAFAYKGDGSDFARSARDTSDGGYIVAGYTSSSGAGNNDVWLLKLGNNGAIAWQKTYGGNGSDYAYAIEQTLDGGYVAAGYTHTFGAVQNIDALVLKFNHDGSIAWQKTYGGNDTDVASAVAQTGDGGYIAAGHSASFGAGSKDMLVMKLSSAGAIVWQKVYGGSQTDEEALSVQQTSDGGFILAGNTRDCNLGLRDILVLKLNQQGDIMWQKFYGGDEYDYAASVKQTPDGGYIIGGHVSAFDTGGGNMQVIKIDSNGALAWHTTLGGNQFDRAYSLDTTTDGGYVLAGASQSFGQDGDEMWVTKLDGSGAVQWQRTYGGESDDMAYSIQQTSDEGYIVAGRTTSFAGGSNGVGILVLKIGNNGSINNCSISAASDAVTIETPVATANASLQRAIASLVPNDTDFITGNASALPEEVCFFNPVDADGDDIAGAIDNCPEHYNPEQNDIYPPGANGIGDACECEGDFNCDGDCDGSDASAFKADFGRSIFNLPCIKESQCRGDFDCDRDCDGKDASRLRNDFGRSSFKNPCPAACTPGNWCVYNGG